METIKKEIIKILEKIDDIHTDGYLLKEYQEKLADQILKLFSPQKNENPKTT